MALIYYYIYFAHYFITTERVNLNRYTYLNIMDRIGSTNLEKITARIRLSIFLSILKTKSFRCETERNPLKMKPIKFTPPPLTAGRKGQRRGQPCKIA